MLIFPEYKCHKRVWAGKIKAVLAGREDGAGPGATLVFEQDGPGAIWINENLSVSEEFCSRHKPAQGTYYVRYEDGYESISPARAFEDGYALLTNEPRKAFTVRYGIFGRQETCIVIAND